MTTSKVRCLVGFEEPAKHLRCLVIGDPHFKITEMIASCEMGDAIVKIANLEKPDFIVCLGDTLDRHETIHSNPLTAATKWLAELTKIAKVYLLIGNHDRPNNSDFLSDEHPFVAIKWWSQDKICVVDKVVIDLIHDMPFFFVPYVPPGRFEEALQTHPDWNPTGYNRKRWAAGFTHQEFYGIEMAPSIFSEKGDRWPPNYPLLINGHIHDRSVPQENIISIGTPRQHAFDESFDKNLSLFTFHPEVSYYSEEKIPLPLPKKIIQHLTVQEFLLWEPPSPLLDHLKLEIHGNRAEIASLRKLDKLKKLRQLGIKVVTRDIEAGQKKDKDLPLPAKQWQQTSFRDRLALRAKGDPEVDKVYQRLFHRKKVIIKKR